MNWLIVKNDFKRNKMINFALFLFIMFSAILAVLSVIMAIQTITSISELYEVAQPPHFLQMHKGELNQEKIDEFMADYEGITDFQTVTMIDVYGENLTVVGDEATYNLSDCRLDIGMVKQNPSKDLLLNYKHERVTISEGEIGMPVLLKEMYGMDLGDRVILKNNGITKSFVIKEIVLDSMMNSTMTSSTRILISDEDFENLEGNVGENEYLIEAYFNDTKKAKDFQTDYENAGLPQNGQAVTYSIIFLLSAISDIATVFVLLFISLLLIIVSFICVKYTIMATLEEDICEIGTMKAIGLPFTDIRELYLIKYRVLSILGVTVGFIISLLASSVFTKHINNTFGNIGLSFFAILASVNVGLLVFFLIINYCKNVLKKIKKVTVVDALVSGKGFEKDTSRIRVGLYKSKKLSVNWLLALRELFYRFKNWMIVFSVVLIAVLMILIPVKLLNTFNAPEFITYMGSSLEDILIEVENGEKLESSYLNAKKVLENDDDVKKYYEYRRVRAKSLDTDGKFINLHIDSGVNAGNELKYLSGRAPKEKNEIAISYLNSGEIGKNTGDIIVLYFGDKEQKFIVSGIYQDVTSGGYTAKTKFDFSELDAEKYSFSVNLNDNASIEEKSDEWAKILGLGVSVDPMKEFINQTLGGVEKQLRSIVYVIVLIGASLVILITVLFLKLRLAKDLSEIAILKAVGFSEKDINQQYMIKIGVAAFAGILTGVILTDLLGEQFVSAALSIAGIGIKKVEFISNPVIEYVACPLLLLVLILLVTGIVMKTIKKYNIISIINE